MGDSSQKKETAGSSAGNTPEAGKHNTSHGGGSPSQGHNSGYDNYYSHGGFSGYNVNASNKPYKYYNRQNYSNQNSGNNGGNNAINGGNRQHYNRKNYNQKVNHANQFNNYSYPANMYAYGYYPSPYGYAAPMVPGLTPMQPFPQQAPYSSLPGGKIKITDKEGKQVDLDEKKRQSNASNTPISSPLQANTAPTTPVPIVSGNAVSKPSPAEQGQSKDSTSSGSETAASSPRSADAETSNASKLSVAEEFKRKILERAAKASADKKKEEDEKKKEEEEKRKVEELKKEEEKKQEEEKRMREEEARKDNERRMKEETEKLEETRKEEEEKKQHELELSNKPPSNVVQPVTSETKEPREATESKEGGNASGEASTSDIQISEREPKEDEAKTDIEGNSKLEDTSDAKEDETSKEDGQTLSQFFEKSQKAQDIEDPFNFKYPEGITPLDHKWKSDKKKYRYDPQFLIQFRDVLQFQVDNEWKSRLEGLGIVPIARRGPGSQSRVMSNNFGNSSTRFGGPLGRGQFNEGRANSRNSSKRRGGSGPREKLTRKSNQSRRSGRDSRDQNEDSKPAEEVKPLEKSANRWVPRSRASKGETKKAPDGSEIYEPEDVERKVKSLLNKLTLEMFEPITDDILKIANQSKWEDDARTVRQVISLTFAKACDEPYWSSMYAQFCAKMCTKIPDDIKDVNIRLKTGEYAKGGDLARRILLTTCQAEYEKGWSDKLPTNPDGTPLEPEMMSDEYYAMATAKRRGLGLVKFIGHLYILNMLNDQVILLCLRDQSGNTKDPSEDSLENLAQLVNTVGARLETTEKNRAVLNFVFDNIQAILDNCKLSSRIKFKLMDLIDLRAAKWKSKKLEAGPKTIQEIHEEAEMKKLEDEKAAAERRRKNKANDQRSNSSRANSSWGGQSKRSDSRAPTKDSKGFTSVQSARSQSNRPSNSFDSTSHLSPRENSKRTDSIQSNANRFAALGDTGDDENYDDADSHREVSHEKIGANVDQA